MIKLLWNYMTREFDSHVELSDEDAIKYIPDSDFAESIYNTYRQNGLGIEESIRKTIKIYLTNGD